MSFVDRAKDLVGRQDEQDDPARPGERDARPGAEVDDLVVGTQPDGTGDATRRDVLPDTGPGVAGGGPAQEQQLEPEGTPGGGDGSLQQ